MCLSLEFRNALKKLWAAAVRLLEHINTCTIVSASDLGENTAVAAPVCIKPYGSVFCLSLLGLSKPLPGDR